MGIVAALLNPSYGLDRFHQRNAEADAQDADDR